MLRLGDRAPCPRKAASRFPAKDTANAEEARVRGPAMARTMEASPAAKVAMEAWRVAPTAQAGETVRVTAQGTGLFLPVRATEPVPATEPAQRDSVAEPRPRLARETRPFLLAATIHHRRWRSLVVCSGRSPMLRAAQDANVPKLGGGRRKSLLCPSRPARKARLSAS